MLYEHEKQTKIQKELEQIASGIYLQLGMMDTLQSNGIENNNFFEGIWKEYWERGIEIYQQMAPQDSIVVDQLIARTLRDNLPKEQAEESIEKVLNSLAGYNGYNCVDFNKQEDVKIILTVFDSMKKVA